MDNVVDPTTGTVKLRAMFDNTDNKLFPSQFVNIRLLVDTLQNQTVVPVAAIQRGADGTFVFVVKPDKTVNQRTVKLGVQDGDNVAILDGLKPGDTVVVDGADRLRDGADVEIPNPIAAEDRRAFGAGGRCRARGAQRAKAQAADRQVLQRRHRQIVRRPGRARARRALPVPESRLAVGRLQDRAGCVARRRRRAAPVAAAAATLSQRSAERQ